MPRGILEHSFFLILPQRQLKREMTVTERPFRVTDRIQSFRYAFRGIRLLITTQHNAWIHAVATVLVIITAGLLHLNTTDWCMLVLATASVWTAEALNTAVEALADAVSPEFHPLIARSKDVGAAAVLIAAAAAVVIGLLVLGPPLLRLICG
jgi:diacylglycerol kinase (ATP)